MIFTTIIILGPTAMGLYVVTMTKVLPMQTQHLLMALEFFGMCLCLRSLFKCSWTDPGIIPSLAKDKEIAD